MARLRRTPARNLRLGHIDSLELLDLAAAEANIRVVFDIGANVGTWTLLAKAIMPDAEMHAFEPLPAHCQAFRANTSALDNVSLHQVALGAERRQAILRVTDFSDASSLLSLASAGRQCFGLHEVAEAPVEEWRLDDYCELHQLPWPDLIKLDVQGYELAVLKGGVQCLAKAVAIIIEVSFIEFYDRQCLFEDVVQVMKDAGLRLHALGINTPLGQALAQTDVLFTRSTRALSE